MDLLSTLNPAQQQAVSATEGPVLVLAGPGSGKTRVLIHRVGHLIQDLRVEPWRIMAVTFTNKAAREMKERLANQGILTEAQLSALTIGTFHAICARILRMDIEQMGPFSRDFVIFDSSDQQTVVKQILKEMNLDPKRYSPQAVHSGISKRKNELQTAGKMRTNSYWDEIVRRVYERYEEVLEANNALDFDDLIMKTHQLFSTVPTVLDKYQQRYQHIMVDEFQDTNMAQYELVKMLSEGWRNIFVVGDEDQCLPAETPVATPTGARPIAALHPGDTVLAAAGRGYTIAVPVERVKKNPYRGKLVEIETASGRKLRATPNHIFFARLGTPTDHYYVYLMYRHDMGYRIGTTIGARSDGIHTHKISGLAQRGNQEHADKMWLLKVCRTKDEALYFEQFFAFEYGIPTMIFHTTGRNMRFSQAAINRLYAEIDTVSRAKRLMADLQLHPDLPHHRPKGIAGEKDPQRVVVNLSLFGETRRSEASPWHAHRIALNTTDVTLKTQMSAQGFSVRAGQRDTWRIETNRLSFEQAQSLAHEISTAGNGLDIRQTAFLSNVRRTGGQTVKYDMHPASQLHPTMKVALLKNDTIIEDEIVAVNRHFFEGHTYDLDVATVHNYVANGVVVHNSIYSWRGADYRNVMRFKKDFPDAQTILLEQNYRSTETILQAAGSLIAKNRHRHAKTLFTDRSKGAPIVRVETYTGFDEARFVVQEIKRLQAEADVNPADVAVMYRTNAQSRVIEEAFVDAGMPYRLVRGTRFYERKEVKDALAYLRLIHNPNDQVSLRRIINVPRRGIGAKTVQTLLDWAAAMDYSPWQALVALHNFTKDATDAPSKPSPFSPRAAKSLVAFADILLLLLAAKEKMPLVDLIDLMLARSGIKNMLNDGTDDGAERWENLQELKTVARNYEGLEGTEALSQFLEEVALVSDVDGLNENESGPALLTLHAAKGLEFPIVFMVGMEEGIFPHSRSKDDPDQMEEERRLAYVGVTRAKDRLYLTHAFRRTIYGREEMSEPSRFLADIPSELVDVQTTQISNHRPARRRFDGGNYSRHGSYRRQTTWEPPSQRRKRESPPVLGQFKIGERVFHRTFGEGTVVSVKMQDNDEEVTVAFPGKGVKRLLVSLAGLEKL